MEGDGLSGSGEVEGRSLETDKKRDQGGNKKKTQTAFYLTYLFLGGEATVKNFLEDP